ncbi:MAG: MoaD/ThiS family protein [Candidatus Thermoplasmatota archaeon]|jgi:sulfur carrier protein ThiS|nr:MoaD/ThiS family protein [Candidatus Thermoplasmatota archaeon]
MTKVKIIGEAKEILIEGNCRGEDVLKQLGLSSSSTIILRNGRPIPEDVQVGGDDEITIIKSFSGG